jgi:hypothetical protein
MVAFQDVVQRPLEQCVFALVPVPPALTSTVAAPEALSTVVPVVTWTSYLVATDGLTLNWYACDSAPLNEIDTPVDVNLVVPNCSCHRVARTVPFTVAVLRPFAGSR